MATSLTLETARGDDRKLVLIAAGEIDLSNVEAFNRALRTATAEADSSDEKLTVDLSAVEYLDSAAINILFASADQIRIIAHPLLMSIFSISGLTELVAIEPAPPTAER
jgi:anti-anti-sigma factor